MNIEKLSRLGFVKRGGVILASVYFMPCLILKGKNDISTATKSPNILVITTDQQNFKALGAHGNPHLNTPFMDHLVEQGVSFKYSYCAAPVSGPSRSSLITSRMPHETGVIYNEQAPKVSIPNMGELFREKGYKTFFVGKWHLPIAYPWAQNKLDTVRGFDLLKYDYSTEVSFNTGVGNDIPMANAVSDFLMGYKDDKPFLLFVSFNNPHDICSNPYISAPTNQSGEKKLEPLPPNYAINPDESFFYSVCRQRDHYGNQPEGAQKATAFHWQRYLDYYYRMTEEVDQALGKVLESLKRSGKEENTLIIFTSDHGEGAAAHKWSGKLSLYEEAVNVPFIINWKGKIKPQRIDKYHLVSGLDVLPTLLDFAGFEMPSTIRGLSIRTIIENPGNNFRDFVVTELSPDEEYPSLMGRMLRTTQYKYNIFTIGRQNEELFDLQNDPGETQNLAYEPAMREIKMKLRSMLVKWMQETNDDFLKKL